MKHYVMLLGIALLSLGACKKDKKLSEFEKLTPSVIASKDSEMTADAIPYDAPAPAINFKAGSIILIKTDVGNYGKMEILSNSGDPDFELKVNLVVYNSATDEVIINKKDFVFTFSSNYFNLDDPNMPLSPGTADIRYYSISGVIQLQFSGVSKGYLYKL